MHINLFINAILPLFVLAGAILACPPASSADKFRKIVVASRVHCGNSLDCPPQVGMWWARLDKTADPDIESCTAFLIAPDLMMTNSHCVPPDLRVSAASCLGRVEVLFPATGNYPAERAMCLEVVASPKYSGIKDDLYKESDYSVVRLTKAVQRPLFELSQVGLEDQVPVTVYSVNPVTNGALPQRAHDGLLVKKACAVHQGSFVVPNHTSAFSRVQALHGCKVIGGNSGSPVLSADGRVHAIVHAMYNVTKEDWRKMSSPGIVFDRQVTKENFAVMSNMACLSVPQIGLQVRSAECGYLPYWNHLYYLTGFKREEASRLIVEKIRQATNLPSTRFEFGSYLSGDLEDTIQGYSEPRCIKRDGFSRGTENWRFNVYKAVLKFDRFLKPRLFIRKLHTWNARASFDFDARSERGEMPRFNLKVTDQQGLPSGPELDGIPVCP